jgi:hypothetical protein
MSHNGGLHNTVSEETVRADAFHLILKLQPGSLPEWRGSGWVCVESYAQERQGRDRFHVLRPALDALHASAALIRGTAQAASRTVSHDKTIIARDAEFWTLRSAEIRIVGRELEEIWKSESSRLIAEEAARDAARLAAPRPAARTAQAQKMSMATSGALFAGAFVAVIVGTGLAMPTSPTDPVSSISLVKREGTTVLVPDPKDPSMLIEYLLHPDGTRTVVTRMPRSQKIEDRAGTPPGQRSLAEGVNVFLRVRQ